VEQENHISVELRSLSTVVSGVPRILPYKVPAGYFDDLSVEVMNLIKAGNIPESALLSSQLVQVRHLQAYNTPEGYFDGFAQRLLLRIKAEQQPLPAERRPLPKAAGQAEMPTEGGLDPGTELEQLSPLLSQLKKKTPFEAPEGYFTELLNNVISGVQAIEFVNDELEHPSDNVPALIADLKNRPTYQVPNGYFEGLHESVLVRVQEENSLPQENVIARVEEAPAKAKVVPMHKRRIWWKYSAAAVVAGLIFIIGWPALYSGLHKSAPATGNADILNNLSKVSDQEIENYLENHNATLAESVTNSTATLDINDNDIKNMLGDVSDDELKQYLDDHGGSKDMATN